ncbi:nitrile hydratase subunit alpha [Mesorhizobium sp.]|jgi:nitrile hydratase|uniref:nitrile hydratase subunit alpha n=1 Tax=Mesorhizobium sp. TaxID=1871066 RepID=UPI0035658C7F
MSGDQEHETHGHGDNQRHDHQPIEHVHTPDHDPEIVILDQAIRELLEEKGIVSPAEMQQCIEALEGRNGGIRGKEMIARAWTDPGFRELLLSDGQAALASMGLGLGGPEFVVVENTQDVHNVIVCTLCSCYPRGVLGLPPSWYKSAAYRSRVVREPRVVLKEFGTVLPDHVEIRVHDSLADLRYMVLPMRPVGTEGWSAEMLAELVGSDAMIGVRPADCPVR